MSIGPRILRQTLATTTHVFFRKSKSPVKYEVFYSNRKEQTLAMNIQTRSWKSEHKHRRYTFTVWVQFNTHKYLLLFQRANIQLTDKKEGLFLKWERKSEKQRNKKVDDEEEKLQLDTVCLNTTIWASTPHSQTGHLSTVKWQSCLRPCGVINPHSWSNEKDLFVLTYSSSSKLSSGESLREKWTSA